MTDKKIMLGEMLTKLQGSFPELKISLANIDGSSLVIHGKQTGWYEFDNYYVIISENLMEFMGNKTITNELIGLANEFRHTYFNITEQ